MKSVNLFRKDIKVREFDCKNFREDEIRKFEQNRISLFIQTNATCQASCPFCIYKENKKNIFDIEKLAKIINEISIRKDVYIRKLNFTGGEPLLDINLFNEQAQVIRENLHTKEYTEVTLNTNGINLFEILKNEDILDSIGLSRHHYDDDKNIEIFKTPFVPSSEDIKEFNEKLKKKEILQLRCNLISGYIDSFNKIKEYMDFFLDKDIRDFGFVTLAPNNDFCKSHQVEFKNIIKLSEDIIRVNNWKRYEEDNLNVPYCECSNYVYSNNFGQIGKFYARLFCNNYNTDGVLVYDGKYLRHGFSGEIII